MSIIRILPIDVIADWTSIFITGLGSLNPFLIYEFFAIFKHADIGILLASNGTHEDRLGELVMISVMAHEDLDFTV